MVVSRTITKTVYTFQNMLDALAKKKMSSKAVDKARSWLSELHTEGEWYEYEHELWKNALAEIGFEEVEISFSGFWSQGDGASFTSKCVDLPKLTKFLGTEIEPADCINVVDDKEVFSAWVVHQINGKPPADPGYTRLAWLADDFIQMHIERDRHVHYVHWNTCTVHADLDEPGNYRTKDDNGVPIPSDRWVWESCKPHTRQLWDGFVEDVETLRKDLCNAIYKSLEASYEALVTDEALADFSEANDFVFDARGHREMC